MPEGGLSKDRKCELVHLIYVGAEPGTEAVAERFIDEGLGCFKSRSTYGRMLKGDQVRFNANERAVFSGIASF